MPYVLAAIVGVAALLVSVVMAVGRLKVTRDLVTKANTRRLAQVARIKKAARATLHLAREREALRRRKNAAEIACEDLEQRLKGSKALDMRLYVLDDRRTQADLGWIARVTNPDYAAKVNPRVERTAAETWQRGRRILVWALDEAKARQKISARYPEHRGFNIMVIERQDG